MTFTLIIAFFIASCLPKESQTTQDSRTQYQISEENLLFGNIKNGHRKSRIAESLQISTFSSLETVTVPTTLNKKFQRFYAGTQIQGHLFGQGLIEIPNGLVQHKDFPYQRMKTKEGNYFAKEIPFVEKFSINRFLGGQAIANVWFP